MSDYPPGTVGFELDELRAQISTLDTLSQRSWISRLAWKIGRRLQKLPTIAEIDEIERKLGDARDQGLADFMVAVFGDDVDAADRRIAEAEARIEGVSPETAFARAEGLEVCSKFELEFTDVRLVRSGEDSFWILIASGRDTRTPIYLKLPRSTVYLRERLEAISSEHREDE